MMRSGKGNKAFKHGMFGTPTHKSWDGAIQRCHNTKCKDYKNWGARGIYVCQDWRSDFRNFLKDMGEKPPGLSLGRIDNDGPYCKKNCEWQTQTQQHRNKRNNRWITFRGKTETLAYWIELSGLKGSCFYDRLRNGWTMDQIFNTPSGASRRKS